MNYKDSVIKAISYIENHLTDESLSAKVSKPLLLFALPFSQDLPISYSMLRLRVHTQAEIDARGIRFISYQSKDHRYCHPVPIRVPGILRPSLSEIVLHLARTISQAKGHEGHVVPGHGEASFG